MSPRQWVVAIVQAVAYSLIICALFAAFGAPITAVTVGVAYLVGYQSGNKP